MWQRIQVIMTVFQLFFAVYIYCGRVVVPADGLHVEN
jgi:hypothetical protein